MNIIKTISLIIIAFVVGSFIASNLDRGDTLGGLDVKDSAYYSGSTNGTSSVGVAATKIFSKGDITSYLALCNTGTGVVTIQETATGTGVTTTAGFKIASSTNYSGCYIIDPLHPYLGDIYGIADATTTLEYIKK